MRFPIHRFTCGLILGLCTITSMATAEQRVGTSSPLAVHVQGNHLVDQNGATVRLLGVNRPGAEYMCQWNQIFDGPMLNPQAIAAIKSWHVNAVRVPLNEDCWLGNLAIQNDVTGARYQNAIVAYVERLNAAGIYAILDLHFNAPGNYPATQTQLMADADHSAAFWISVATKFKQYPAVVFDVFNEPGAGQKVDVPPDGIDWACWLNGCSVQSNIGNNTTITWTTAGMQSLVTAVRSTGATQPIMLGGLWSASDLSEWLANEPSDPLTNSPNNPVKGQPQLAASWHTYCLNKCSPSDLKKAEATWSAVATVSQSVPVIIGEFGEFDCATTYVTPLLNFADEHGLSYLGWAWIARKCGIPNSVCALLPNQASAYMTGAPSKYGIGLKNHLAGTN